MNYICIRDTMQSPYSNIAILKLDLQVNQHTYNTGTSIHTHIPNCKYTERMCAVYVMRSHHSHYEFCAQENQQ